MVIAAGFIFGSIRVMALNDTLVVLPANLGGRLNCYDSAFYLESRGEQIFYRKWGYPQVFLNHKIILIIHGLGYHSQPYKNIMDYLPGESVLVYAMDLKGHGLSGGDKGVMGTVGENLSDINQMRVLLLKRESDSRSNRIDRLPGQLPYPVVGSRFQSGI